MKNEPLSSPTVVSRPAMVTILEPPPSRVFASPRNCRTVRPLKAGCVLKFCKTRSPNRIPEAPDRNPASEKSLPNAPDAVEIGLSTWQ